ncbi:YihY/virulence factor BrkB family protein [Natrinema sp. SYSU A 869]|uniref:YihY/virulence factor BrkB family protein n=1 Tax=Natrinema sp. SYSU A 869 TaxID=2871694 RepID=UPI001CA40BB7|nr:YihY/virulence factor BrkB family protein [Natrinema sp. SYSU A 869]
MSTVGSVVALARDRNLTFLAAGIAYYAFVSTIPLLLLAVTIASFVGGQALADRVSSMLSQQLSSSGQQMVSQALTDPSGRAAASVVGFLALAWSALKLFRGLDQAFDEVYSDDVDVSLLGQVRDAIVVIVGTALAVALVVAVGAVLSILNLQIPFANVLGSLVLIVVLTIAFLPIYYVLPPVNVSLGEVIPGTALSSYSIPTYRGISEPVTASPVGSVIVTGYVKFAEAAELSLLIEQSPPISDPIW